MTHEAHGPSDVIGTRVKQVRQRRGWSAAEMARRCTESGLPLTRQAITNVEAGRPDAEGNRRRHITAEELFGLAYVLDVSPLHLVIPPWGNDRYAVTAEVSSNPTVMRAWVRGSTPLPGQTESVFISERPANEIEVVQWNELEAAEQGERE